MYKPHFPNLYNSNKEKLETLFAEKFSGSRLAQTVLDFLSDTDFYEAPASTKYHGAVPGGLFDHSYTVAKILDHWVQKDLIEFERPISPFIIGILHDFTKVGRYKCIENVGYKNVTYEYNKGFQTFGGHGEDSLCKILLNVNLTEEEAYCIRFHMGPYEKDKWSEYDLAIKRYPNVLWTHHADMIASKVKGV